MKLSLLIGIFFILCPLYLLASRTDSTKAEIKSININPAFVVGTETGFSLRIEYESSNWGKVMINSMGGLYFKQGDYVILDLGLGYGYPIVNINNNKLFVNGHLTWMQQSMPVSIPINRYGPSVMLELEYRKTWRFFSINITPGYRVMRTFGDSQESRNDNALRLRIGCLYSFRLKD